MAASYQYTTYPLAEAALSYAAEGMAVFPLAPRSKIPLLSKAEGGAGWKDATTNLGQVQEWWTRWPNANIGYAPRGHQLIIDIDLRHQGKESWARLIQTIDMPETRRVRTGNGYHLYFTLPEGLTFPSCDVPGSTLEIKCETGYLLLPPSIHPDGPVYTWMNPDTPLAPVPDSLIALLLPKKESKSQEWKQDRKASSVIDAFNARYTIYEQLERNGYLRAGNERYKRPGGHSASVVILEGARSYHHSSSDELHSDQTHDAFSIYCHLDYAGDVKAAVKAAAELLGMKPAPRSSSSFGASVGQTPHEMEVLNTDAGNARRLVTLFGQDIRYCPEWNGWLVWNGHCWERDLGDLRLMQMAKRTVQSLYKEAQGWVKQLADERPPEMIGEEADKYNSYVRKATELLSWARKSEESIRLHAMIKLARSEPAIPVSPELFDQHPYLLNVANGTLNLGTGELRGHQQRDYLTTCLRLEYDVQASCPRWEQFLSEVLATPETVAFMKRAAGYTLTGDTSEQVYFFLGGEGSNGKSTLLNTLLKLWAGYGQKASIETFMETQHTRAGSNASPDLAELPGKRLVSPGEVKQGHRLNEQFIKDLVGADPLAARQVYERQFSFIPQCKLWMYGNYEPRISGRDYGIWRRVRYIPFKSTFKDEPGARQPDKYLPQKLLVELPGILAWAVQGCLEWQAHGLGVSQEIQEATDQYKERQDVLAPFLADCCVVADEAKVKKTALWKAYQDWLTDNAEASKFDTSHALSRELKARGVQDDIKIGGVRFWKGIGLREETTPPPPSGSDTQDGATLKSDTSPAVVWAGDDLGQLGATVLQKVQNLDPHVEGFLNKVAPSCPKDASEPDGIWADGTSEVAPKCPTGATSVQDKPRSAKIRALQKQWPVDPPSAHQQRIQALLECLSEHLRSWNVCQEAVRAYVAADEPPYTINFWGHGPEPHKNKPLWTLIGQALDSGGAAGSAAIAVLDQMRGRTS